MQNVSDLEGHKWNERVTYNFCYLSTQWAYLKSVKLDYWVPLGHCVGGGTLQVFSSVYVTKYDFTSSYCPYTSTNYAGGRTFWIGTWYPPQDGRLSIVVRDGSFWDLGWGTTVKGMYAAILYK